MTKIGEIQIPGAGKFTIHMGSMEKKEAVLYRRFFVLRYNWNELTEHGIRKRVRTIAKYDTLPEAITKILSLFPYRNLEV